MEGSNNFKNLITLTFAVLCLTIGNYPRLSNSSEILKHFYVSDNYHQYIYNVVNQIKNPNILTIKFQGEKEVKFNNLQSDKPLSDREATPTMTPIPKVIMDTSRILIIGDSRIQTEVGIELELALIEKYNPELIQRVGIPKSGLSRQDFYDWNDKLTTLIEEHQPTIVVAMLGANDGQRIYKENTPLEVKANEQEWNTEYLRRVKEFQKIATDKKLSVIWIGNPISGLEYYNTLMQKINELTKQGAESNKYAYYIDVWSLLANTNGEYTDYLDIEGTQTRVRTQDKIHLTRKGGAIVGDVLVEFIDDKIAEQGVE
jgi:uncharacterized protein